MADWKPWLLSALVGAPAALYLYKRLRSPTDLSYLAIAQRKRALRDAEVQRFANRSFPAEEKQRQILGLTVQQLKEGLDAGAFTSEEILLTLIRRTIDVGLSLEAVGDVNFEEALAQAKECDRLRTEGKADGLLFGIPISVKDVFHMKGFDSTCGMTVNCFHPQSADGLILQLLKLQGAIPFVRTNVPFAVLSLDSQNRVWGNTKNPWNRERTAGGSSGGEGALVASDCSVLGLGNDFGGSTRYPASVNGICGFMGTGERGTTHGEHHITSPEGGNYFPYGWSRATPLARCVDDLVLLLKSLWAPAAFESDRLIPRLPFNDALYTSTGPLVVAVVDDSVWDLPASVRRALEEAAQALRAAGHTVVKANIDIGEVATNFFQMLTSGDSWNRIGDVKGAEPWLPSAQQKVTLTNLPRLVRQFLYSLLSLSGSSKLASILRKCGVMSAHDLMEVLSKRDKIVHKVIEQVQELGAEIVLMPAALTPPPRLGSTDRCELANVHIFAAAHLTFPSGVVPITLVRPEEESYVPMKGDIVSAAIAEAVKGSSGLPVGVQVCALPFRDEVCLRVMRELEREVRFSAKPATI